MPRWKSGPSRDAPAALVTGAGSGIGAALAAELTRRGWRVAVTDRDASAAGQVAAKLPAAVAATLDVADSAAWSSVVRAVESELGPIGLLVNNAGIAVAGPFERLEPGDWERVLQVNVLGVVRGIEAVYPQMLTRGAGTIVNVASGAGLFTRPGMAAYAASKAAVVGLTRALHAEAALRGVHVMAVCPGYIGTGIMSRTSWRGVDGAGIVASIPIAPMSPEACAARIVRAAGTGRAVETIGGGLALEGLLQRLAPGLLRRLDRARAAAFARHQEGPSDAHSPGMPSGK